MLLPAAVGSVASAHHYAIEKLERKMETKQNGEAPSA